MRLVGTLDQMRFSFYMQTGFILTICNFIANVFGSWIIAKNRTFHLGFTSCFSLFPFPPSYIYFPRLYHIFLATSRLQQTLVLHVSFFIAFVTLFFSSYPISLICLQWEHLNYLLFCLWCTGTIYSHLWLMPSHI